MRTRYLLGLAVLALAVSFLASAQVLLMSSRGNAGATDDVAIAMQPDGSGFVTGLDAGGSFVRNLSPEAGDYGAPRWSPDGSMVAFAHYLPAGAGALVIVGADGTLVASVSEPSYLDGAISWAPNSEAVVYAANYDETLNPGYEGLYHIITYDIPSETRTDLTDLLSVGGKMPDWSSANEIGFSCDRYGQYQTLRFCFVGPDGQGLVRVAITSFGTTTGPIWSPNAAYFAYSKPCGIPCGWVVVNSIGPPIEQLDRVSLNDSRWTYSSVAWSPDGTRLLTADASNPNTGTWLFSFGGSSLTPIVQHDPSSGTSGEPAIGPQAWSPDGQLVAIGSGSGTYIRSAADLAIVAGPLPGGVAAWRPVDTSPGPTPTQTATALFTPTPTSTPEPPVVVLVHGYDFNAEEETCGMEPLGQWIETPANTGNHAFKTECLWYRTREGVRDAASRLEQRIAGMDRDRVDILTHSMGGLVARYYVEQLGGWEKVRSLTMLGTPNWGTLIAIPPCTWALLPLTADDQGACDLVPMSPLIRDLNIFPGSHEGVSYQVVTGWLGPPGLLAVPNDCVVEAASARGLSFPLSLRAVLHINPGMPQSLIGCASGTGVMDDLGVRQEIADILLAANGLSSAGRNASAEAAGAAPPVEPAASTLAAQTGLISQGETVDLPVEMPEGETGATFVYRAPASDEVTLSYELLRPGGTPVADTDPDASLEQGQGYGGHDETHFAVTLPGAGTWTMRISAFNAPDGGWPYDLQAYVSGRIAVEASTGAGHYDVGESIALSAAVSIGGEPVSSAVVDATITKPDGSAVSVPLSEDEPGEYVGSFSETSACGMYQVVVTADGIEGDSPFTRVGRALAVAGVPGNVILDPCNADSDGDGLTDEDEVYVHLTGPAQPDTDDDRCTDGQELGPNAMFGGQRDPLNPWDYFNPTKDGQNRVDDILAVVNQYLEDEFLPSPPNPPDTPNPDYNPQTDRTALGPNLWNLGPPNGLQRVDDILHAVNSYFHDCG